MELFLRDSAGEALLKVREEYKNTKENEYCCCKSGFICRCRVGHETSKKIKSYEKLGNSLDNAISCAILRKNINMTLNPKRENLAEIFVKCVLLLRDFCL